VGAAGRVGRRIAALAIESGEFDIVGAIDRRDHPEMGTDVGALAGTTGVGVALGETWPSGSDVAIDFSLPEAADDTLKNCTERGIPLVMGTTGLSQEQQDGVAAAARKIPIVFATVLGEAYDIEIVEQHHRFKKDAPSGSALTLAQRICEATGRDYPDSLTHGRRGKNAQRQSKTIGMHAVRAGDITGVHSVIYGTLGETITLNHAANSRDTFVRGALRAAAWLLDKQPGLYSMADVLDIK
jgi:4-hydroxy-tetrahydrodipicolinate reductase